MSSTNGHAPTIPGVSDDVRAERGYTHITSLNQLAAHEHRFLDRQKQIPGLLIPQYRLGLTPIHACSLRSDDARIDHNGKTIKYEHPAGVPLCLDVLPRYRDALGDPTIPIWITEGAKKADALASAFGAAIVPISLNGVWGWMRKGMGGASYPLDDLDAIEWAGRDVELAFDSDVTRKPEVQHALKALARHLTSRGARVRVLVLPQIDDQKIGVDDALAGGMTPDMLLSYIRSLDELPAPTTGDAPVRTWLTEDELDNLPPPSWLVDQQIAANGLTVLYGPSGSGKTFVALDYALQVAQTGAVLYLAAEDVQGIAVRKRAWREFHQNTAGTFYTWPEEVNLLNPAEVDAFIDQVQALGITMFVVDTLHQCMVGGDENGSRDMGVFIQSCKRIQRATGAAPLVLHHTGKNGATERGSSALRAAAYTMIELRNDDGLITVACDKAKNSTPFPDRHLRLLETGESCVVVPAESVIATRGAPLSSSQRKILETLNLAVFEDVGAKSAEIGRATGIPDSTLWRTLSTLKRLGYVTQGVKGDPYYINEAGRARLDAGQLSPAIPQQNGQLSQLSPNSHQLSESTPQPITSTLSHSHTPIGVRVESRSESGEMSEVDHDRRREQEVDACLAHDPPDFKRARASARLIRGRKDQERVEEKIDAAMAAAGVRPMTDIQDLENLDYRKRPEALS